MDRLILMRHAKAERRAESGRDFDRALNARGVNDAAIMGQVLARAGMAPDLVVYSSAARTTQTWLAASAAFRDATGLADPGLYNASAPTLWAAAERAAPTAKTVMLVAHNPGIHELALALLREGGAAPSVLARASERFPTSTVAVFSFDAAERPIYDGTWLVADHGGGGGE